MRALTLESLPLIDPTESRYATIAQHMLSSGDWVTPHIPDLDAPEPYLGKPPLHFWLTTISFAVFGQEEWVSRIPSFLAALLTAAVIGLLAFRTRGVEAAGLSVVILSSSAVFYFFSGASVTDLTLTACVTVAVGAIHELIFRFKGDQNQNSYTIYEAILFIALACGFLTKGPIALVLVAVPVFLLACMERKASYLKLFFSKRGCIIFTALVAPWFILSEIRNPGFLKYFLINENFGRYLLKDYGDRYGVGHRHHIGAVWWMLAIGTLPWGILLVPLWRSIKDRCLIGAPEQRSQFRFLLAWASATPVFFTFVKQLHLGYIIPAIPPFALVLGIVSCEQQARLLKWMKPLVAFSFVIIIPAMLGSLFLESISWDLLLAIFTTAVGGVMVYTARNTTSHALLKAGASLGIASSALVFAIAPILNTESSSLGILQLVSRDSTPGTLRIGVIRARNYSPWYYEGTALVELGRKFDLVEMQPESLDPSVHNIIMVSGDERFLGDNFKSLYNVQGREGSWVWYTKTA